MLNFAIKVGQTYVSTTDGFTTLSKMPKLQDVDVKMNDAITVVRLRKLLDHVDVADVILTSSEREIESVVVVSLLKLAVVNGWVERVG